MEDGGVITRILILVGLCIAASTTRALEVIDVGVYVPEPYPGRSSISWLDDERFVFAGYLTTEELPLQLKQITSRLFEYNITTRKLIDKGVSGISVCYDNGYVRYSRPKTEQKPEAPFPAMQPYYGHYGEEQPLPPRRQAVPSDTQLLWNCLYDSELPPMPAWMAEAKKQGRIFSRLRPEHGWVELGKHKISDGIHDEYVTYPIRIYKPTAGPEEGLAVRDDFTRRFGYIDKYKKVRGVWSQYFYVPHQNAYVIRTAYSPSPLMSDIPMTLWWLYPDGRLEEIVTYRRTEKDWPLANTDYVVPAKTGIYFIGADTKWSRYIGDDGIYQMTAKAPRRVVAGRTTPMVLSPDGCKLAYGNDDRILYEGIKHYKLQIMNVCEGERK